MNRTNLNVRIPRLFLVALVLCSLVLIVVPTLVARAATITVNSLADTTANDGVCTLREAIINANANAATWVDCVPGGGADTINFSVSGTITLGSQLPWITDAAGLTINGPGVSSLTISGANTYRVFGVAAGTVTLQNLTVANGSAGGAGDGGGILVNSGTTLNLTNVTVRDSQTTGYGGGIHVRSNGTIVLNNVTISGNRATSASSNAGGLFNTGTATLTNVTVSGNQSTGTPSYGGGIVNTGQLSLTNVAITGNSAGNEGGVYNGNAGANATLVNVTISGNTCSDGTAPGCGFSSNNHATATLTNVTIANNTGPAGTTGGISDWNSGSATLRNTLVANNSGGNCSAPYGGTLTSSGYNLSSDTTCNTFFTQASDLNNTNPLLAALALNPPGTTQTHGLLADSPAIDKIPSAGGCGVGISTDQRGIARPQPAGGLCDIGAFEGTLYPLYLPLILKNH